MVSVPVAHTYTLSGGCAAQTNYVVLSVTNAGGYNLYTNPTPVVVYPAAPAGSFTIAKANVTTNETVSFTDISTGCVSTWKWAFGDGGASSAQSPTHAYLAAGTYSVYLAVTNAYGLGWLQGPDGDGDQHACEFGGGQPGDQEDHGQRRAGDDRRDEHPWFVQPCV